MAKLTLRSRLLATSVDEAKAAAQQAEVLRRQLLDRAAVATHCGRPDDARGAGHAGDLVGLLRDFLAALVLRDDANVTFFVPRQPFWSG